MKLFVYRAEDGTYLCTQNPSVKSRTIKDFFYVADINRAYVSSELDEYIRSKLPKAVVPIEVTVKRVVTPVEVHQHKVVSLFKTAPTEVKSAESILESYKTRYNGRILVITWQKEDNNRVTYDSYGIDSIDFITMCELAKALETKNWLGNIE